MVDFLKKELDMDFDKAVKKVETIVEEEGFSLLLTKDLDKIFKKNLGVDYSRYTMILACAPEFAKGALDVSKNVGLLFPCSFVVYEDQGKVFVSHISIMKIAPEIELASADEMQPVIDMTGEAVHKAWDRL
ncbi:MAG: DUF302 domain-containing protein [Promethearchaeati archaeon]